MIFDLEPIKMRLKAATSGEWSFMNNHGDPPCGGWNVFVVDGGETVAHHAYRADAVFIANAKKDITDLIAHVERLEEEGRGYNFDCQTLEMHEKEIYHLRNIVQNFLNEYESVDDSSLNGYGVTEIDIAVGKLRESFGEWRRAGNWSLAIIRDAMVQSGLSKEFADDAFAAAILYEGVEHLMMIWYEPVGDEFYKQEIIADIQEIIDEIKASKPLNEKE